MEEQKEPGIEIESQSLRSALVRAVLEHFVNLKQWEPLEIGPLTDELAELLRSSLAFETIVELNNDPEVVCKSILAGKISFLQEPVGNEPPKQSVIQFEVLPTIL